METALSAEGVSAVFVERPAVQRANRSEENSYEKGNSGDRGAEDISDVTAGAVDDLQDQSDRDKNKGGCAQKGASQNHPIRESLGLRPHGASNHCKAVLKV
jgi:hypothetical protein